MPGEQSVKSLQMRAVAGMLFLLETGVVELQRLGILIDDAHDIVGETMRIIRLNLKAEHDVRACHTQLIEDSLIDLCKFSTQTVRIKLDGGEVSFLRCCSRLRLYRWQWLCSIWVMAWSNGSY